MRHWEPGDRRRGIVGRRWEGRSGVCAGRRGGVSCGRRQHRAVRSHESADLRHRLAARLPAGPKLRNERSVVHCIAAKPALSHMMRSAERLDIVQQVVHDDLMRRIYPSGQDQSDGHIRKLCGRVAPCDTAPMPDHNIDLKKVVSVLSDATAPGARFSQRGLAKAARLQRDAVGDIIRGRNLNPTIKTLRSLADAMETDLSVFGIKLRSEVPTEAELEGALREALTHMPAGEPDRLARYLASAVALLLQLPPDPAYASRPNRASDKKEDDSSQLPTN